MTDPDRGAYTPQTDAPLAFDARQSRREGGGRSPFALIFSGVALVALIAAIVVFYRGGVRGVGQPPQPVGAPVGEIKTAPPPQAPVVDESASLDVYRTGQPPAGSAATAAAPPTAAFAPPPEEPLPRPTARPSLRVERSDIPPVPAARPTTPVVVAQAKPLAPAAPPAPAAAQPKPAPLPPAPPKPAPVPAAAAAPAPAPAASGPAVVQIGAFSSEALAAKGWSDIAAAFPSDMGGKGRRIEAVPGSTLQRSMITGFPSREAASAFCAKLKAAGKSCFVK
jgi:hypothetical protein